MSGPCPIPTNWWVPVAVVYGLAGLGTGGLLALSHAVWHELRHHRGGRT